MWKNFNPCKMNLILIFLLLQAVLKVNTVFGNHLNSSAYNDDDFEVAEDEWRVKELEYKTDSPKVPCDCVPTIEIPFNSLNQVSPNSVAEVLEEDAFEITKEWIENYLMPIFKAGKMIPKHVIQKIIREAKFNFSIEDTIQEVYVPYNGKIIIVGDIHGQFDNTLTIFEDIGFPNRQTVYIFNGDIVDRGDKSLECILTIFAYKIAQFGQVYVSRGNHESMSVKRGSFYEECRDRLTDYPEAFEEFHKAFEALPYGYIVEDRYFVIHGGLAPEMDLNQLKNLFRTEYNYSNDHMMYAMLWNDPCEQDVPVYDNYLVPNRKRGGYSFEFHPELTRLFLKKHGLKGLIRSHQMASGGSFVSQNGQCLTIFSAPNYCNLGNDGAVVLVTETDLVVIKMRGSNKEVAK